MEKAAASSWLMLGLAWLIAFSLNSILLSVTPLFSVMREDLAVSFTALSLLVSVVFVASALLAIPGGLMADTLGVKRAVGMAVSLVGLGGLLRGLAADYPTLLAFSALFAVGFSLTEPNLPKLVSDWFPRRLAGTASGIYVSGFPVGATAGLALSFALSSALGSWRLALALWGALGIAATAAWWLLAREPAKTLLPASFHPSRASVRQVFRRRGVRIVALMFFLNQLLFFMEVGWLPSFYIDRGVEGSLAGVMVSTLTLSNLAGVFLAPFISDRVGLRKPFLWLFSLASALAGYLLLLAPVGLGWLLLPILGFSVAVSFVFSFLLPIELAPDAEVGSASGIVLSIGSAGALFGPLLVGYLKDATGSFELLPALLAATSIGIALLSLLLPETGRRARKRTSP